MWPRTRQYDFVRIMKLRELIEWWSNVAKDYPDVSVVAVAPMVAQGLKTQLDDLYIRYPEFRSS